MSKSKTAQTMSGPAYGAMALAVALAFPQSAYALPSGEAVVSGAVAVTRPNAQRMVVQQGSDRAIVNWQGFSIGSAESVAFQQPGAASVILNRVVGGDPSSILGRMTANGRVFLVNPNGVFFAPGASADVGGLVASTLNISNVDFLAGRYQFVAGGAAAAILNQGTLRAADGGTIALLGGQVSNDGIITAQMGTVALAAGNRISLDFAGDGLTKVTVDESAVGAQLRNSGMIIADGGQAVLTAHAAQALTGTVINQTGVVRARSLAQRNGRIVLDGGDSGVTLVSGTLDASGMAAGETGGEIQVLGHDVGVIDHAQIDASGDAGGGTVLIGGDYQGKNPLIRNAAATYFGPQASIRADAINTGNGGKVIVWGNDATRAYGTISARGGAQSGNGGFVETSGHFLDVAGIRVDAAAPHGLAGKWLLDPADITIAAPPAITTNPPGFTNSFFSEIASSIVSTADIEAALNAGTSVSITTSDPASGALVPQPGNITVAANIAKTAGGNAALSLSANNDIVLNPSVGITASGPGTLDVTLTAQNGNIVMNSGTTIQSNGGIITLIMNGTGGNFQNVGGGTLVPGPGGHWEIWQTTWIGEVRGGLSPGNPLPNIYGCSINNECGPPDANNHFLYADRPTALVVADNKLKTFGDPNPPLTFTVQGLINGDTAGDAVAGGALATTATQFSTIGVYPIFDVTSIDVPLNSPAGYIIDTRSIVPGVLAVQGIPDKGHDKVPGNNDTGLYDRNIGLPHMCVATGPLGIQTAMQGSDQLDVEWSRVRQRPNVTNCIALGERNTCDSF